MPVIGVLHRGLLPGIRKSCRQLWRGLALCLLTSWPLAWAADHPFAACCRWESADETVDAHEATQRGEIVHTTDRLTVAQLQQMLAAHARAHDFPPCDDATFLRRITFDLLGRPPTAEEFEAFIATSTPDKDTRLIERLLADPAFGMHWANYWSDVISFRVPPPELTYLDYRPFKRWLAEQLNRDRPWDEIVQAILAASGKVKHHPAVTFVAYHGGHPQRLATETARIFLSVQIGCAQCHDHPFDEWKRPQFHELAAYFARTRVKFPWNDGTETLVSDAGRGEYHMPDAVDPAKPGQEMIPTFLTGEASALGLSDLERRRELARQITHPENRWFARAWINRIWAQLFGRGFYEPVDDFGLAVTPVHEDILQALSHEFVASNFDVKGILRLITSTPAYRQRSQETVPTALMALVPKPTKLTGDQLFAALQTALELPNLTPPPIKPTPEMRFPPPPQSTRDLIAEGFNYDPSLKRQEIARNLPQAMLLMNFSQLHHALQTSPGSNTCISRLVQNHRHDPELIEVLFIRLLSRLPSPEESQTALQMYAKIGNREVATEDLVWSLINSTEFLTRP
ncbi:MAG: hypothetical protein KatS3mg114_1037 [Planctomycetaceae bacterium]|nr:MAG: hypothetical protein KatS3mg114_1037 [Planctomycetaceae bacterium]